MTSVYMALRRIDWEGVEPLDADGNPVYPETGEAVPVFKDRRRAKRVAERSTYADAPEVWRIQLP